MTTRLERTTSGRFPSTGTAAVGGFPDAGALDLPKISIRNVSHSYAVRGRRGAAPTTLLAVDDFSLDIRRGEFVVIVGPSGCGKSTLLDFLSGLVQPTAGTILDDGEPVVRPGLGRAIVFQQYALFPWRTAEANIEFGLEAKGIKRRERKALVQKYLSLVGLEGFGQRYPHELSGGMKQRVAIARSLAYEPDVILMDEPFAALDAQTREQLQDELLRIWRETGKTIVFITHSIDEAVYLGQRVAVMTSRPGRLKEIVTIDHVESEDDGDVRSNPDFARQRHTIWNLLRDEVIDAARTESGSRD